MSSFVFVAGTNHITSKATPSDPPCVICEITKWLEFWLFNYQTINFFNRNTMHVIKRINFISLLILFFMISMALPCTFSYKYLLPLHEHEGHCEQQCMVQLQSFQPYKTSEGEWSSVRALGDRHHILVW